MALPLDAGATQVTVALSTPATAVGAAGVAGLPMIAMVTGRVANCALASVTLTVKLKVPDTVGVPLSRPVLLLMVIPVGRAPLANDQTNGVAPPVTVCW